MTTHDDLHSRLVACALELLHRDHPEDLSIREVARRAGVSSGAPYHHFGDKKGLLAACASVGWERLTQHLEAVDATLSIEAQLRAQLRAYFDFALSEAGCYRLMMSRLFYDIERYPELESKRAQAMGGILELIARDARAPSEYAALKARGVALWSMMHGFAILRLDGSVQGQPDPEAQVQAMIELAVRLALLPPDPQP
ncbi:MAG: TetR/AcrR family transcriptional regulator [Myxococcota bacterium]